VTLRQSWTPIGDDNRRRSVPGQEERRRSIRSTRLGVATLACRQCDAPIAIGDSTFSLADELACPYCGRRAPVRDFLTLGAPTRPTRVVLRVRQPSR
jgi:DNA-directed RNA polymerase subunit RPC12/RpoP